MEDNEPVQQYRVHVIIRRQGQGAFDSFELKTEDFDNIEQMWLDLISQGQIALEEDADYLAEHLEAEDEVNV